MRHSTTRLPKPLPDVVLLRKLLLYNPRTGELVWKARPRDLFATQNAYAMWNTRYAGKLAGNPHIAGYLEMRIGRVPYLVHRVIWKLVTGIDPANEIDHKNGDRADNRWENLREATSAENKMNTVARVGSITGWRGVRPSRRDTGRFVAYLTIKGKMVHVGTYDTAEEAKTSRDAVAKAWHGKFFNSD